MINPLKHSNARRSALFGAAAAVLCAGLALIPYFLTFFAPFALLSAVLLVTPVFVIPVIFLDPEGSGKRGTAVAASLSGALAAGLVFFFTVMLRRKTSLYRMTWPAVLIIAGIFVILLVADRLCKHTPSDDQADSALTATVRSGFAAGRLASLLLQPFAVLRLLGFYDPLTLLDVAMAVIFFYCAAFSLVAAAARLIRREYRTRPDMSVPVPFSGCGDIGVIGYLEKNTGITMRSLWSIKMIRRTLPIALTALVAVFWFATGLHEVKPYERGALYRFGKLSDRVLEPGLSITLPYPFDKVEKYETETVKELTVGYISKVETDVIWTEAHGGEEFKLLVGGGNELVSVNLRIEYRISDLLSYIRCCSSPDKLLEAAAYELVTKDIISTDLETLLSIDRQEFSETFVRQLREKTGSYGTSVAGGGGGCTGTGLEIVSVVLESIHPPVNVAAKYQELISAGIDAGKKMLQAEGYAKKTVAEAEALRDSTVNRATADGYSKIADARASVSEFMAGVEADSRYSDSYRNYKYLSALTEAYRRSRLILVGEGIDSARIWLGE